MTVTIIICVVLLIIVLYLLYSFYKQQTDLLAGLWKADTEFCDNAGVEQLLLFIEKTYSLKKRVVMSMYDAKKQGYGLVKGTMSFWPCSLPSSECLTYSVNADLSFLPKNVRIVLNILQNKLTICDDDMDYGIFYKASGPADVESDDEPDDDSEGNDSGNESEVD